MQLTPPGSACSITIGTGPTQTTPGTYQGLHLVVDDIEAAGWLTGRGVDAGKPFHFGAEAQTTGIDPAGVDYGTFMSLSDPDGSGWLIQDVKRHVR